MAKVNQEDEALLHYQQGTSDKVYHVYLRQLGSKWAVETEYGRRGGTLSRGVRIVLMDWAAAWDQFNKIVAEKTAKGYVRTAGAKPTTTELQRQLSEMIAWTRPQGDQ